MAELDIPKGDEQTVLPSTTEHGAGATLPGATKAANGTTNGHAQPVTMVIVGAGQRGQVYASYALKAPHLAKVVAVAEPRPHRRKVTSKLHNIPPEMQFEDWEDLANKGKIADAAVICVMDALHASLVETFAKQGYHILCEKPMATSISDCVKMVKDVEASGKVFGMGHVLRYSPYNIAIKKVIESGVLGDIINIQHIEPVGNQHFSHSYVRGNWRKESETSFALMAKCCHDIDILSFYLSGSTPIAVSSFGSIGHFKKSRKPAAAGSAKRCLDCAYEPDCVWSAKKIYVEPLTTKSGRERDRWAKHVVDADVLDIENVTDALKTGPYGRCVYECDNDVADHQVVNIEYEDGVTASMTMSAFTKAECDRGTQIHGTKGELIGDMETFTIFDFLTRQTAHHAPELENDTGQHGGGDQGLSKTFVRAVAENNQDLLGVTPKEILNSHLLVFAAEKSRKERRVVEFGEFKAEAVRAS